jgi:hypothetical protein
MVSDCESPALTRIAYRAYLFVRKHAPPTRARIVHEEAIGVFARIMQNELRPSHDTRHGTGGR